MPTLRPLDFLLLHRTFGLCCPPGVSGDTAPGQLFRHEWLCACRAACAVEAWNRCASREQTECLQHRVHVFNQPRRRDGGLHPTCAYQCSLRLINMNEVMSHAEFRGIFVRVCVLCLMCVSFFSFFSKMVCVELENNASLKAPFMQFITHQSHNDFALSPSLFHLFSSFSPLLHPLLSTRPRCSLTPNNLPSVWRSSLLGVPTRPFWRWMWCRGYHSKASAASLPSGGSGNCGDNQGMEERGWGGREMESDCIEHWHTAKGSAEGRCCFVLSAAHAE